MLLLYLQHILNMPYAIISLILIICLSFRNLYKYTITNIINDYSGQFKYKMEDNGEYEWHILSLTAGISTINML